VTKRCLRIAADRFNANASLSAKAQEIISWAAPDIKDPFRFAERVPGPALVCVHAGPRGHVLLPLDGRSGLSARVHIGVGIAH
jgi:hypothetical protein